METQQTDQAAATTAPDAAPAPATVPASDPVHDAVAALEAQLQRAQADAEGQVADLTSRLAAAVADRESVAAQLDAERGVSARRLALLREVQWAGPEGIMPTHRRESTCPNCGAFKSDGHTATCRVAAELA